MLKGMKQEIEKLREQYGTFQAVARRLGISDRTLRRYRKGDTKVPWTFREYVKIVLTTLGK